ncbi:condensation domain-containing protein, partial [Pseudonocardia acaciae]|uniref:condensation domain-containing protein n=1 Tax=Pseudonocardia acaciae TaxID=551276 RepID=UPI0012EDB2CA
MLRTAMDALLLRHPNLGACFPYRESGTPIQVIPGRIELPWAETDLSALPSAEQDTAIETQLALDRTRRIDLARPPLLRCTLLRLTPVRHILALTSHHILMDGWSLPVLARELEAVYAAGGHCNTLLPTTPFREYLAWLARQDRDAARNAWRQALTGLEEPTLVAPGDPAQAPQRAERIRIELPEAVSAALSEWARRSGITLNTVVQGAWALLLGRLTGRDDVVFGTTVSGRPAELAGVESMVGLFINTVPVRVRLTPQSSLRELLVEMQDRQAELLPHQHLGLSELGRLAGCGELFDTLVVFANYPAERIARRNGAAHGLRIGTVEERDSTHYPLSLLVIAGERPRLHLHYRPDLFDSAQAEAIAARFVQTLETIPADPDLPLARRAEISPAERERLVADARSERQASAAARTGAARTEAEAAICALYGELLGLDRVGVDADFFALGGDSIVAIQLVARARRIGWEFTPRDVFLRKNPAALAMAARFTAGAATRGHDEPGAGVGVVPLTPIMHWLAELDGPIDGFYQSMDTELPLDCTHAQLTTALQSLLDRHDALRTQLHHTDHHWILQVAAPGTVSATQLLHRVEVSGLTDARLRTAVARHTGAAQQRLKPETGAMVQALWFDTGAHRPGRLLLLIHHLAVDGVSWRILMPELDSTLRSLSEGRTPTPEPASTSFRQWARRLTTAARSPGRAAELEFWRRVGTVADPTLGIRPLNPRQDVAATARRLTRTLSPRTTTELLTTVPAAFHAEVNDALLTCFTLAVAAWRTKRGRGTGSAVLIQLEGHGREDIVDDVDLSRTVGWFTTAFPVHLDPHGTKADGHALKTIKEQLRAIPDKGIGYGLLRYLNPDTGPQLRQATTPQIGFNYLGRYRLQDSAPTDHSETGFGPCGTLGEGFDARMPLPHALMLDAITFEDASGPRLQAQWTWAGDLFTEAEIDELATEWFQALETLAAHAQEPSAGGHTPSDFPLISLNQTEIDRIETAGPITDVLPLTPLQQGILFHATYDPSGEDHYITQLRLHLEGPVDTAVLRAAAQALVARHAALRAGFRYRGDGDPVQFVVHTAELPWAEVNFSGLPADARPEAVADWLAEDQARRFDPAHPPLLRCTLLELGAQRRMLLLTSHHIVMDGWSMPVLLAELGELYARGGDPATLPPATHFREYLAWLARQDRGAARDAWGKVLAGLEEPTLIAPGGAARTAALPQQLTLELSARTTEALAAWARGRGLTINTLVQAAWAVLLSRLTGRNDVVFGITVSARPAELAGVESMVGLFINTLPVRVQLTPGTPAQDLMAAIQDQQAELLPHQHLGLTELGQLTGLGSGELFDTLVVFENYPGRAAPSNAAEPASTGALPLRGLEGSDATHYPLTLCVYPGSQLHLRLEYQASLCSRSTAEAWAAGLVRILETVAAEPSLPVGRLDPLHAAGRDRESSPTRSEGTAIDVPPGTLPELFTARAAWIPDAVALVTPAGPVTYARLEADSNRLARHLITHGVGPDVPVAVALPASIELVTALLAIMKAGGIYVPLDPSYPAERLNHLITDCAPALLITATAHTSTLPPAADVHQLLLDNPAQTAAWRRHHAEPLHDAERHAPLTPNHPAYMIYTSGSTGTPKGVVVEHASLTNLFHSLFHPQGL